MGTVDMLENAVRLYTRSLGYLKSLKEGAARVNLAGEPTGSLVTADEAAEAAAAVIACKATNGAPAARTAGGGRPSAAAAEQMVVQPIPDGGAAPEMVTPETAQPRRIGLADLKAAALARRQLESAT